MAEKCAYCGNNAVFICSKCGKNTCKDHGKKSMNFYHHLTFICIECLNVKKRITLSILIVSIFVFILSIVFIFLFPELFPRHAI